MKKIINCILIILILNELDAKKSNNLVDYLEKLNLNQIKLNEDISVSTLNDKIQLNTSSKDVLILTPSKKYLFTNFSRISLFLKNNKKSDNIKLRDKLLVPNSKKFNEWFNVNENFKLKTKFYLFNVTNPDHILKGEKPILKELGPFTYLKRKWYKNLEWQDNENLINVRMFKNYTYIGKLNLNDKITTVNIPLHFIFNLIDSKDLNEATKKSLYKIFQEFPLFVTHKIGDLLFNRYQDDLTANFLTYERRVRLFLKDFEPKLYKIMKNGFSLMGNKNNTNYGLWTLNTGKSNLDRIGQLEKLDGNKTNNCWFDSCSVVNGTDGLINSPYFKKNASITIFIPEHYRSFRFNRAEFIEDDFKIFKMSTKAFDSGKSFPPNKCYLKKDKTEKNDEYFDYNGVLKDCTLTSLPIVTSNPHFLFGDKFFSNQMIGLSENEEEHDSYIKFSTLYDNVVNGKINSQINFDTKSISKARNLTRYIFPVFWSSELFHRINND